MQAMQKCCRQKKALGELLEPIQNVCLQKMQQNEEAFQNGGLALKSHQCILRADALRNTCESIIQKSHHTVD